MKRRKKNGLRARARRALAHPQGHVEGAASPKGPFNGLRERPQSAEGAEGGPGPYLARPCGEDVARAHERNCRSEVRCSDGAGSKQEPAVVASLMMRG